MKIDFKEIINSAELNFKGGKGLFQFKKYEDDETKIMLAKLEKGSSIGFHRHDDSNEVVYILKGKGIMICDCEEEVLNTGDASFCGRGGSHTLKNDFDEELVFFSVITKFNNN